jgi:hypothetical protein
MQNPDNNPEGLKAETRDNNQIHLVVETQKLRCIDDTSAEMAMKMHYNHDRDRNLFSK